MTSIRPVLGKIPREIWVLGFVSLLMDISSEIIHSLLPMFMLVNLGVSAFSIGIIEGAAEATALIVKIFSGVWSDYIGKRKGLAMFGYSLSTMTKPIFALASGAGLIFAARVLDRLGKGIRGAPRDALITDITPPQLRGAAFGLRQSLDTVGAFLGPLLAVALMLLWNDDFRRVFWVALIPGILAVLLLQFAVQEAPHNENQKRSNPIRRDNLSRLGPAYWWVVGIGSIFTLARFSEAFLVLRAQEIGIPMSLVPLVMVAMNLVYSASAYPFGRLSDKMSHSKLLMWAILLLGGADIVLAFSVHWWTVVLGLGFWGLHMGMSQGLLAAMVADTAPADLRGTAFGFFNLCCGLAMLIASGLAGFIWEKFGSVFTFIGGVFFCLLSLAVLAGRARKIVEDT